MLAAAASRSFIPLPARPAGARNSGVTKAGSASAWYVSRRGAILDSEDSILAAFSALTVFSFLPGFSVLAGLSATAGVFSSTAAAGGFTMAAGVGGGAAVTGGAGGAGSAAGTGGREISRRGAVGTICARRSEEQTSEL